ncbi:hypothetical protein I4U23_027693 [Adineta vaga]|nr:hypothetical protein I4U23_027693 [Adineta vaga]
MDGENDELFDSDSNNYQYDIQQANNETTRRSAMTSSIMDTTSPNLTPDRHGVMATEDEVTKHFYHNKLRTNSKERIPSEVDSLENDYSSNSFKEKQTMSTSSSPIKSILKKPQKKREENFSMQRTDRPLSPCLSSCSSLQKKENSLKRLDSNEVPHLADITAKQNSSSLSSIYPHSLFSQTMNIFDPDNSYAISSRNQGRSSRLQYYIKPYRGEPYLPTKQRSRSLSRNRLTQTSTPLTLYSSNQSIQPSTRQSIRKQQVSWSPSRQCTAHHEIKNNKIPIPKKRKNPQSSPTDNLSTLNNYSSVVSIPIRFRKSQSTQFPSPSSSYTDSYSFPQHSLTTYRPLLQISYRKEEEEKYSKKTYFYNQEKRHDETIERYNHLLERMRITDTELQSLSRSWINPMNNNIQERRSVSNNDLFYPEVLETYKIEFFNG